MGGKDRRICEFEASLVYRVSSRIAKATQRNPVSKTKQTKTKQNKRKKKNGKVYPVNLEVYNDIMCYLFLKM